MLILARVLTLIFAAVAVRATQAALLRHRISAELRGDWWAVFEREFQAYASGSWEQAREAEQSS